MWCRHCQQDVPAIASGVIGPLVCPRCEFALEEGLHPIEETENLGTAGVELTELDVPKIIPLREVFDSQQVQAELNLLGRRLGAKSKTPASEPCPALHLVRQPLQDAAQLGALQTNPAQSGSVPPIATYAQQRTSAGWWVSALLGASGLALAVGLAVLAYATLYVRPELWNQALTVTLAGEGGLIVGLAWMAKRLWQNSRRLNRQISGVDRQLDALQFATEQRYGYDSAYYRRVA
ncbi:hypothetical protein [Adhaeretor mobilis]|uniref:Uncharacterized protein n=1 Tax=Adhaeretor mobilis TaxID=1930276 RepID=A0A517N1K8_9BACT|nr:hypothetical protein [Adhaeretor mobilis]QDT01020.1 hypothetical protein HG15A2_43620 [Adhaeretor mobilis]